MCLSFDTAPFCSLNMLSNIEKSHIARYQRFSKGVRYQYLTSRRFYTHWSAHNKAVLQTK